MKVVILCGGFGTRIRDVAEDIPKPMIKIGDHPILWHIMKYYSFFGYNEFILCLGYKGYVIKDYFLNYKHHSSDFTLTMGQKQGIDYHSESESLPWKITFAETGLHAMTGTRIRRIKKYIDHDEEFLLTYGDGLSNVDLNKLIEYHKKNNGVLTLTAVRPASRFGELVSNEDGIVTEFNEKPQSTEGRINGGFFVCDIKIFNYLSEEDDLVFENEPMQELVKMKLLFQFPHDGFWQPMDTFREYTLLNKLFKNNEAPWKIW